MASELCTVADLYDFGLPRGTFARPGRRAYHVDAATDVIELDGHGYADDDTITVRADGDAALPAPLAVNTVYYVQTITASAFRLAATAGGAGIDITEDSDDLLVNNPDPTAKKIQQASADVLDMIPAHVLPLEEPYPPIIVMTTAELAAARLGFYSGTSGKSLVELVDAAAKRLARWASGIPIRGENAPAPANNAIAATAPLLDLRGWSKYGGIG